jgi:uncharacterized alpha-E superfamily protein
MLSRIANSLFWMGRYIERSEHLARYTKVHYFSALDAPQAQNKEALLTSILKNAGLDYLYFKDFPNVTEQTVIFYVALDLKNPYSIIANINFARENARGARDSITTELWEAINKYYHFANDIAFQSFEPEMTYDLMQKMIDHCSIIKGLIDNTMVHDDAWHLLCLGIHLERAIQISNIIRSKTDDIANVENSELNKSIQNYHWPILLKCAESFDMCNRYYKASPSKENALEFLILNQKFPKSISYCLTKAYEHLQQIVSFKKQDPKDKFIFNVGKLLYKFKYLTIEEILEKDINAFLTENINIIFKTAGDFEKEYLNY